MRREIPKGALQVFIEEDGHVLQGMGTERKTHCWNPLHDDSDPSMYVNVAEGLFHCKSCDIRGNAVTYLTEWRNYSRDQVREALARFEYDPERMRALEQKSREMRSHSGADVPFQYDQIPERIRDKSRKNWLERQATYDYRDRDGQLICRVARYVGLPRDGKKPDKQFRPFVPHEDGWFMAGPLNQNLPVEAQRAQFYPLYGVPELLAACRDDPQKQVMVVEGEKCVDAVRKAVREALDKSMPVTSLFNGSKKLIDCDLSPLYGKKVLLVADADAKSRRTMKELGKVLRQHECTLKYCMPRGDTGYDVADAAVDPQVSELSAAGKKLGAWGRIQNWIRSHVIKTHEQMFPRPQDATPPVVEVDESTFEENPHFQILGMHGDEIVIRRKSTNQLWAWPVTFTSNWTRLISIAPREWWLHQVGEKYSSVLQTHVVSNTIIRIAEKKGDTNVLDYVYGRGAARLPENDQIVFNTGQRILRRSKGSKEQYLDEDVALDDMKTGNIYFDKGPPIALRGMPEQEAQALAREFYEAIKAYRWADPDYDGNVFVGWLVTSLIGGCLRFRPHLWLTAAPGTGKSYLLEQVLERFIGNDMLLNLQSPTEAGFRENVKSDSIPVVVDEFEPKSDKIREARNNALIDLLRSSTSGSSAIVRGGTGGGTKTRYIPRFSAFCTSVDRPNMTEADQTRILHIKLSPMGVADWKGVRNRIERLTNDRAKMVALRTYIIRHAPFIAARARSLEDKWLDEGGISTRDAQMMSAIVAGVHFISGQFSIELSRSDVVKDDQFAPLSWMLGVPIRLGSGPNVGNEVNIAQCISSGWFKDGRYDSQVFEDGARHYRATALRYGFKMASEEMLYVAPSSPALRSLLERSPYASLDTTEYLSDLPGTSRELEPNGRNYKRTGFGGSTRYAFVALPQAVLARVGFTPWAETGTSDPDVAGASD